GLQGWVHHPLPLTEDRDVLLRLLADAVKRERIEPKSKTFGAFMQPKIPQAAGEHGDLAGRTRKFRRRGFPLSAGIATGRAIFCVPEHHLEAGGTRDGGQSRAAMSALRVL